MITRTLLLPWLLLVTQCVLAASKIVSLPVSLNMTSSGTISLPGQQDRFTFSAIAGQRVLFDTLDVDADQITATLVAPSGTLVFDQGSGADAGPVYLVETGTYTLLLDGDGDALGNYSFRLLDLANAAPLTLGVTITNSLAPRTRSLAYQFAGIAGQRLLATNFVVSDFDGTWSLIGPADTVFSYDIASSPGEIILPTTGNYVLLFASSSPSAGSLDFRSQLSLVSNPSGAKIGFGVTRQGNTALDQTNVFTYTAPAGTVIFLDALTNISPVSVCFYDPVGASVPQLCDWSGAGDVGPLVLPRSGNYRLEVVGTDAGSYNFRLLDLSNAPIIAIGTNYSGVLAPFQSDIHRFNGTVGQRIHIDTIGLAGADANLQVISPDGGILFSDYLNSPNMRSFLTLNLPGTYIIVIENLGSDQIGYGFRLVDATQSPTIPLSIGTVVSGAVNRLSEGMDWFRLAGVAGQSIYFDAAATNSGGLVYVQSPDNQFYIYESVLSADFEITLPLTGSYLIGISPSSLDPDVLPYSFQLRTPLWLTNQLQLGTTYSNSIGVSGNQVRYLFAGTVGQPLFYDALSAIGDSFEGSLQSPSGAFVSLQFNGTNDLGPFQLSENGTYLLSFRLSGAGTNSFRFRLLDLNVAAQSIAFDTPVNGVLNPGSALNWYRFTGSAAQRLFFDGAATNSTGTWQLFTPNGQIVAANNLSSGFDYTIQSVGTYLLGVSATGSNSVPYSIRIITPTTIVASYTVGTGVTNSLTESGEERRFTFGGTAGQRLLYDGLETDFDAIQAQLLDPNGNEIFNINSDEDSSLITLARTGQHTLVIRSDSGVTGDFRFRLLDLAAASLISYGTVVSNQLAPRIEADLFRISGVAGQRISITNISASAPEATWTLSGPNDSVLLQTNIQSALGTVLLPLSGTYAVAVLGSSPAAGTLDYQFRASLLTSSNGASSGFNTVRSGTTTPGVTNSFTFVGTSALPVYFDYLTNGPGPCVRLLAPNGTQIFSDCQMGDFGPLLLPTNGTYTIRVSSEVSEPYRFRMLDLGSAGASNLTFGTTYSDLITTPFHTDVYRINAAAGQRLVFDWLSEDNGGAAFYLYSSLGEFITPLETLGNDSFVFTAAQSGIYYLAAETFSDTGGQTYKMRMLDAAQAPATTLTLNTLVSGNLNPGTRTDVYRFNGVAGQRMFFAGQPTNGAGEWRLFDPQDSRIGAGPLNGGFEAVLPITGQYLLLVGYGSDTNPAPYAFRALTTFDATNAIAFGATVTATLTNPGDARTFSFSGSAGQRIVYDCLSPPLSGISIQILSPSGTALFADEVASEQAPMTLLETGTYLVRILSSGETNSVAFRFLDAASVPTIPFDAVVTGVLTNPFSAALYQFSVMPNLRLFLDQTGPVDPDAFYAVYDPVNNNLAGNSLGADAEFTPGLSGQHLVVLRSTSALGAQPYTFAIVPANHAPSLAAISNILANEESLLTFSATANDLEVPNDVLTWTLDPGAPAGALINPATGVFTWTPTEGQGSNVYTVTIRVRDDGTPTFEDVKTFSITVNEVNKTPTLILPQTQTINESATLSVALGANDADAPTNTLTFALVSGPSGLAVSSLGLVTWTPQENQAPSTNPVTVRVFDNNPLAVNAQSLSTTGAFNVVVNELNQAPVFTGPGNLNILEEAPFAINATATDADVPANPLTFALISGPAGLNVSSAGVISWTPNESQGSNVFTVSIRVTDLNAGAINAQQLSATNTFFVTVLESNRPPVLVVPPNTNILTATPYSATATAGDPDVPTNTLTFGLVAPPIGMSINPSGGVISWTPSGTQGGTTNLIRVTVTDTNPLAVNTKSFTITNSYTIVVTKPCTLVITNQPVSRAAAPGSTASLAVGVTTSEAVTNFQWQLNGTNLPGQVGPFLTFSNLTPSAFGTYRVQVNDGTCTLTSAPAVLTIAASPTFRNLQRNGTTFMTSFQTEFGPTYVIEAKTNLGVSNWTVLTNYPGDGTSKTFTRPTQPLNQEFIRIRLQ